MKLFSDPSASDNSSSQRGESGTWSQSSSPVLEDARPQLSKDEVSCKHFIFKLMRISYN